MIRSVCAALAALSLATLPTALSAQKVAYINSQKIIARTPGFADADAQLKKENEGYQAQIKAWGDSLNAMMAAYQKAEPTMTPAAKQAKQQEIREKQQSYQQKVQELEQKARSREQELVRPLMDRINKIIEDVRVQEGYAMVFDAGNQAGVVVAADTSLDITEKVIAKVAAMGPVAATPSSSAQPDKSGPGVKPAASATSPTGVTRPKTPPGTP